MATIKKYGVQIFFIVLLLHCVFIYFDMIVLRAATKFLLLPILISYLAASNKKAFPVVYVGLVFAFIGDVLLSRQGELFFLLGMLAFAGTHIFNIIFFIKIQKGILTIGKEIVISVIIVSSVIGIVGDELKPHLGNFELPVGLYMAVISLMALTATGVAYRPWMRKIATSCFIPGAAFFILSDSILALNKFIWHQPMMDIIVILTYGTAQYFLVKGFIQVTPEMNSAQPITVQ